MNESRALRERAFGTRTGTACCAIAELVFLRLVIYIAPGFSPPLSSHAPMSFATLLSVLLFALHWRLALCVSGSSALAMVLVYAVPWLEGVQGLALGLLGLGVGMVWEGGAKKPPSSRPAPVAPTSTGVARTCALIIGAAWGACSAGSMQAFLAGAVILGLTAWAWRGYAGTMQPTWPRPHVHRCIGLAALAYGVAAAVVHQVYL